MKKKGQGATYILILACILLSKVLGLARGVLLSAFYGTGMEAEVFQAVSKLPLMLYDVTLGTAIASAFIPVFNERLTKDGKAAAERFAGNFMTLAGAFSALVCVLGMVFPRVFVNIVASGFEGEKLTLALEMMRYILPVVLFATVTYILIGILQSYEEFTAPSLVSLFTNLALIFYFLVLNRRYGIKGLAVAFTVGWGLQFVFLLPFIIKKKFRYHFSLSLSGDMKRVLLLTPPLFISSLAQPINTIISTKMSSELDEGALSVLSYAYDAYFILAAVFASAMTNLYFPELSRRFAAGDRNGAAEIGGKMIKTVSAIVLPITAFMMTCGTPIIRILYQRGKFTAEDTTAVAGCLAVYSIAMLAFSLQEILNKFFYSMQKTIYPMIAAVGGILLNFGLSVWFVNAYGDYRLLTWATVVSGWFMALLLLLFVRGKVPQLMNKKLFLSLGKTLLGSLALGVVAYFIRRFLDGEGMVRSILCAVTALVGGALAYFAVLWLTRSEELGEILSMRKKKKEGPPCDKE
ncbi:MAG: murein biosynthesis integral membrane protein MurJ [Clostridia bacterium]|nr:murein biosynthesis integral membrane protein MurJ [Clostridia bacterium]